MQGAGAGQAHPVAGLAEVVAQRGDEAQAAAGLLDGHIVRRSAGDVAAVLQGPEAFQLAADVLQRQELVGAVELDLAERHGLDQGGVAAARMGPGDQVGQFGGVVVLERHGVDLHRDAGGQRRVDPGDHLGQVPAPGQLAEQIGLEGVHRDVDAAHAEPGQVAGELGQPRAVGGQGQLIESAALQVARQVLDQAHDALADQGLAAGDPQLADAEPDEARGEAVELLQGQDLRLGQEGHVLGHAVDAAQVAAVGDRDPQIGDGATEPVDQAGLRSRLRRGVVIGRHARPNIEGNRGA